MRITAGFLFDRTMRILVIVAEEFGRIKGLSSHNAGTTQQYGAFPELCIYYKTKMHSSCEIEDFVETHLCKLYLGLIACTLV